LSRALHGRCSVVANAAHELRTPLTAIRIQSQCGEQTENTDERILAYADFGLGWITPPIASCNCSRWPGMSRSAASRMAGAGLALACAHLSRNMAP
jgi:signal transduction histidine kinase